MVEEGLFPHQTRLEPGDPRAQKPNNTLLVIGSLAWDPILPGLGFDSMAKQLFHHFASAAWTNDLFHAFGLVRTLFWVPHDDFKAAIAQAIAGMQKANASLEMTANLNVVVNAEHTARGTGRGTIGREPQYEIESAIRALQAGRANGMDLPIHRRDHLHECAEDIENMSGSTGRTRSDVMQDYLYRRQLEGKSTQGLSTGAAVDHSNEERRLRETYPELYVELGGIASVKKKTLKHEPGYEELTAFWKARAHTVHITKLKQRIEAIADLGEDMYYLECKVLEMEDGSDKEAAMKRLEEMDEEWKQRLSSIPPNYGKAPVVEVDDRLALRAPPYPRLQWDRRPFEPLIMRSEEVWPRNRLSLVSAEPIPKPPAESSDWYDWVQDFVFGLYSEPSKSVIETLDKMQHGLSDIIKDCPSLKDPKKGGRLNMHHLRVRLLTQEMIKELVTAYKTWPFKKPGSDHNKYFRNHGSGQQWGGRP
jgi:transcription factor 1